eukprot:TRINITY_DN20933_c0_g1_i1.p1 TRINITY_DN20933_c0_g1~~TRINITY_DN20933_c0_g1_i1.p1  ORF type:complete len:182 (-),score=38.15 TRINITY_DN20933_c0_g1_i1:125-670(-)
MGGALGGAWGSLKRLWTLEGEILMVGLDNAGKSTILYKLNLGEVISTAPTVGFNIETVTYGKATFTVWDMGGQKQVRPLWRHHYQHAQGLIFVVDSNDPDRMEEAREEIHTTLGEEALANTVVLILGNKQDMPKSLKEDALIEKLRLTELKQPWHLELACALDGQGLDSGLGWLCRNLPNK